MATTKLMTADDLLDMGEDAKFCELIIGELVCMSPASGKHSQITGVIFGHLWTFARDDPSHTVFESSAGYILGRDPDVVLSPDVSVVRSDRFPAEGPGATFMELVPDLVVEVISPSERPGQITTKLLTYLNAGVQVVWYVDPENKSVTIHAANEPPRT
ncbi:MAG: Uma2 family endonuclease, partial [Chloroflexia bacterium]|nr:Uma2 family endonuclease [Chloroflexia bacterium]